MAPAVERVGWTAMRHGTTMLKGIAQSWPLHAISPIAPAPTTRNQIREAIMDGASRESGRC